MKFIEIECWASTDMLAKVAVFFNMQRYRLQDFTGFAISGRKSNLFVILNRPALENVADEESRV